MRQEDDFSSYYAGQIQSGYDCVDRIVVNAYFGLAQSPGGFRTWWRRWQGGDDGLTAYGLKRAAGDFGRRLKAYCKQNNIPWRECAAGEVKHALAEELIPKDRKFTGVFAVLVGRAPAPMWQVRRSGRMLELFRQQPWPHVQHYYFQIMDPDWGHIMVRICGYPPFGAQVVLNGHEWVERQAWRQAIAVRKESNCFIEGSDFAKLDGVAGRLCGEQLGPALRDVCERWLYTSCLCFALRRAEQERTRFEYSYSVWQLEYSRNWLFHGAARLEEIFQKVIDRTRRPLGLEDLETIFGIRSRLRLKGIKQRGRRPEMVKAVGAPDYDTTVFRVRWGQITLKIYDKSGRVLRVEVMVHNTRQLKCGKRLDKLPELLAKMEQMLIRFLSVVQAAHVSFIGGQALEEWPQPTQRGQRRLAGMDLNKARNRTVACAVISLATKPEGFSIAELAQAVRERASEKMGSYTERQAAYDLAKMRGKELVGRIEGQRRYKCEPAKLREICAYLILREEVIKPLLAGTKAAQTEPPKNITRIDRQYIHLRKEMQKIFPLLGLAA